jgi:LytS/YehU family sensor histidine kinase
LPSSPEPAGLPVPGLTLQPLVENAIRHGIARRAEGGRIRVAVEPDDGVCRISVWNQFDTADGPPDLSDHAIFRPDHALSNIRDRLLLHYGDNSCLQLAQSGADWIRATVTIPCPGGDDDANSDR